jgi:hypothetical protein
MANRFNNNTNPRNPASQMFRRLTRLFSGPITDYRSQNTRMLTRRRLDKYRFRSASGQQFKKTTHNPLDHLHADILASQGRSQRYADFNQMEYTPEIASALDIYADEMSTMSAMQPLINIECQNEEIKSILEGLYNNVLNLEFNLFGWCRTLCKFGDFFLYLDIDEEDGISNVIGLPPHEIERLEGEDKTNPNYVQFQWNSGGMTFENWQIGHFRILGNDKFAPYGTSVLDPARRIWRQLTLLEDAVMAYRIVRSPERRVFYIDVGNIPNQEIEQYMQKVVTQMKRNQVVDSDTGRVDLRYNPLSIEEDYYIPVRGGSSSKIESLPGGSYTGDIEDIKYLRDKLFSALKVPGSYLSNEAGESDDKTTLAQKDIRFARTIQRLQRSVITELEKIGVIHLYIMGYRASDLLSFKLKLNNPSKLAEMQELEHWKLKFDTAGAATEGYFSKRWVAENIFNVSEEELIKNQREMFFDKKFEISLEAVAEQESQEAAGEEGGLGDLGGDLGDLGGDEGADLGDLGGDEGGDLGDLGGEEPEGAEDVILAEPAGKRDDPKLVKMKKDVFGKVQQTTTAASKGKWYKPVSDDKRKSGASGRRKNMKAAYKKELAGGSTRNVFPGGQEIKSLVAGITETSRHTLKEQEDRLFSIDEEVKELISEVEQSNNEVET